MPKFSKNRNKSKNCWLDSGIGCSIVSGVRRHGLIMNLYYIGQKNSGIIINYVLNKERIKEEIIIVLGLELIEKNGNLRPGLRLLLLRLDILRNSMPGI